MKLYMSLLVIFMGVLLALAGALIWSLYRKQRRLPAAAEGPELETVSLEEENQRRHLRIAYPTGRQPVFQIRKHQVPVADISEKGICFFNPNKIKLGKWVRGEIMLQSGVNLVIEGEIVRQTEEAIGLSLITPIPYKTILAEKRLLDGMADE